MANKIAYIGISNFDIILYQAYLLYALGKKVLIADVGSLKDIIRVVPIPKGVDLTKQAITYQGVDFTVSKEISKNEEDQYDLILVNYGFTDECYMKESNHVVYVSDLNLHTIQWCKEKAIFLNQKDVNVLLRDVIEMTFYEEILQRIKKEITVDINYLYLEETDMENALRCQYEGGFYFKISKSMRNFLFHSICLIYPPITKKEFMSAYKKLRKGDLFE